MFRVYYAYRSSSDKLENRGFAYRFKSVESALKFSNLIVEKWGSFLSGGSGVDKNSEIGIKELYPSIDPESYPKMFFFNEKEYSGSPLCGLLPWFDIVSEKKLWNFELVSVYLVPVRNEE